MGNGSRVGDIVIDIESGSLDIKTIEDAAQKAMNNFGQSNHIFISPVMMTNWAWEPNPEFSGTEWAKYSRISKRERAFAKLQVFLIKFGLQKHLEDPDMRRADCEFAAKRLRRAKWAKYQQRKSKQT